MLLVPSPELVLMLVDVLIPALLLLRVFVVTLVLLLTVVLLDETDSVPPVAGPAKQSSRAAVMGNLMMTSAR